VFLKHFPTRITVTDTFHNAIHSKIPFLLRNNGILLVLKISVDLDEENQNEAPTGEKTEEFFSSAVSLYVFSEGVDASLDL
jgi:hypothetical protein